MTIRPNDVTDLYLAPVALHIDRLLDGLAEKTPEQVGEWVALCTDLEPRTPAERADLTLRALQQGVDTHKWAVHHDVRGIRLTHDEHTFVLGIPDSLRTYLDGATHA